LLFRYGGSEDPIYALEDPRSRQWTLLSLWLGWHEVFTYGIYRQVLWTSH
jgi:hypothetical protein